MGINNMPVTLKKININEGEKNYTSFCLGEIIWSISASFAPILCTIVNIDHDKQQDFESITS